ncbi:restriction endonuclease subunit S domain-containing protein [Oerskovia enterophila]|uniref:Type-1 restriction enzyme EcoKI specificity protein n=1 Tax=Oerskovia enterophila TaxID=43678 RepID=A0ABX2Y0M0_9CELL|nr:restriction endonuclease subunit S [Oerskovia enterophila]OCI30100.1 type-1 restriction enzyme EcoKI specificity protein [Oerskovia enterophila]
MNDVPLGELIRPANVERAVDRTFPILSMTMRDGLVDQKSRFKKQIASADLSTYKVIRHGQLVVGFPIDEGVLDFQLIYPAGIVSPAYGVWDLVDDSRVDRRYLKSALRSSRSLRYYRTKLQGSTARRRSLPNDVFLELPIHLPSIEEQRRIATILDQADAIRAKRRQILTHLDALAQSTFHAMFDVAVDASVRFDELTLGMRNGVSPSTHGTFNATVLTLSAVTRGPFNPAASKSATFDTEPPEAQRVSSRDLLICRGNGNKQLVGVGVRAGRDRPDLVFPDTIIAARIDIDVANPRYLEHAWRQPQVRRQIESGARTTNGTYKVNQQVLGAVELPLPSLSAQQEFAGLVAEIEVHRCTVERALAADDELFASLQSRAFRGEL